MSTDTYAKNRQLYTVIATHTHTHARVCADIDAQPGGFVSVYHVCLYIVLSQIQGRNPDGKGKERLLVLDFQKTVSNHNDTILTVYLKHTDRLKICWQCDHRGFTLRSVYISASIARPKWRKGLGPTWRKIDGFLSCSMLSSSTVKAASAITHPSHTESLVRCRKQFSFLRCVLTWVKIRVFFFLIPLSEHKPAERKWPWPQHHWQSG